MNTFCEICLSQILCRLSSIRKIISPKKKILHDIKDVVEVHLAKSDNFSFESKYIRAKFLWYGYAIFM